MRRILADIVKKMRDVRKSGESIKVTAKQFGVSEATAFKYLKDIKLDKVIQHDLNSRGGRAGKGVIRHSIRGDKNVNTKLKYHDVELGLRHNRKALRDYLVHKYSHKCLICGYTEWNGKLIPLELDHIDGDYKNDSLGNLRIICPNCHAQTDTYKAKNRGKGRPNRK